MLSERKRLALLASAFGLLFVGAVVGAVLLGDGADAASKTAPPSAKAAPATGPAIDEGSSSPSADAPVKKRSKGGLDRVKPTGKERPADGKKPPRPLPPS